MTIYTKLFTPSPKVRLAPELYPCRFIAPSISLPFAQRLGRLFLRFMSAASYTLSRARPFAISSRWIIGPRDDLLWFIGPVVLCYLLLSLQIAGFGALASIFLIWTYLFDSPHVFSTFTRTYLDREERRQRRRLLLGSLVLLLVGPLAVLLKVGAFFFVVSILWSHFHQIKQHYGFAVLYKKKNDDIEPADNKLDNLFLFSAFLYPALIFSLNTMAVWRRLLAPLPSLISFLRVSLLVLTAVVAAVWLGRQVQRLWARRSLNLPKYALFAATIPLHWAVLLNTTTRNWFVAVSVIAPLHTLQYHRLMWFYDRKYSSGEDCKERYGVAEFINRRLLHYVAFGVLYGVVLYLLRRYAGYLGIAAGNTVQQMFLAFLLGPLLIHFHLDSKIWRVRRDPSVGKALGV